MHRQAGITPDWHYRIGRAERDALADQIVELALRFGFDLPKEAITSVELMGRADAIAIKLDDQKGRTGIQYLEYPMVLRHKIEDPVILKPTEAYRILEYLHTQRWRQERRRMTENMPDAELSDHVDGDAITRWARAMTLHDADRIKELIVIPDQFREIEHNCIAQLNAEGGIVIMNKDEIVLPFQIPEVFAGQRITWLGDLLSFPSCGNQALDHELSTIMVTDVEVTGSTVTAPACTIVKLGVQAQKSLTGNENSTWRKLRAIRPFIFNKAPDYLAPDIEAGAAEYHAACNMATGVEAALPICLKMDKAP